MKTRRYAVAPLALLEPPEVEEQDAEPTRSGPPRKWGPGDYLNLLTFDTHVHNDRMFWWDPGTSGKPLAAAVVMNMPYRVIRRAIDCGTLRLAGVRDAYTDWLRDELLGKERER